MAYPKFVIKKSSNDKYYFNLHAVNSQIIATSEMYEIKVGCKIWQVISSLLQNSMRHSSEEESLLTRFRSK